MASTNILGYNTLIDVVKEYSSMDANGSYLWMAQVLDRRCPLIKILPMVKSNQIMSNIGARDAYTGSPGTRMFNQHVSPTATKSTPYSEPIAMFEDYSQVDYNLWRVQNEPNKWRQNQDRRKVEGFTQKLEYEAIYGSIAANAGTFNGLATRFASSSVYPNNDSTWFYNVVLGGGSGSDTTSIWFCEAGEGKVNLIYPKNLPGGLEIEDLGKVTDRDSSGGLMEVLRTHYTWFIGMDIGDERCVQRYANIETSGSSNIFDADTMIDLKNRLPGMGEDPATFILCNRTIKTQMEIAAKDSLNRHFDMMEDAFGRKVASFHGIPIYVCEKIVNTETAIS